MEAFMDNRDTIEKGVTPGHRAGAWLPEGAQ